MKRPGDILRKRREELGLSLAELESSSNIPRRSLEALEREQYDFFAAESYYIGFLKNYAESLKLDSQELLNAYQNVKIIESPLPMEELTGNRPKGKRYRLLISFMLLLLFAVGGLAAYFSVYRPKLVEPHVEPEVVGPLNDLTVEVNRYPWMQDLKSGLILRFVLDVEPEGLLQPELKVVPFGPDFHLLSLNLEEEHEIVLAHGKTNSLPLRLNLGPSSEARFRLDFTLQNDNSVLINLEHNDGDLPNVGQGGQFESRLRAKFEAFQQQEPKPIPHAILQAKKPVPLQLQLTFLRDSYIRYQWEGQNAQEFPVLKNKVLLLQGETPLVLWLSDVKMTKIKVNGQSLSPEAFQNVFIGRLEWKRDVNVARLYLIPGP
ncbi:MAG: helix-turn-helix domain-containing protein [Spirochaetota bacterium]